MDRNKKPHPEQAIINRIIKVGGQLLPGMVPFSSVPESDRQSEDEEEEEEEEELTVQPMDLNKSQLEQAIINRIIKVGGQLLPGMVPFSSVPESDRQSEEEEELTMQDNNVDCMEWWLSEEPWKELEDSNVQEYDAKSLTQKAKNLKRAIYVFERLQGERGTILQDHINLLQEVANNTDKKVKIASIIMVAVQALGLAAVVTVKCTTLTRRDYLAVAAVAALGVSANIISNIYTRKKVEKKLETVLKEHSTYIEETERCVRFIASNVACLKKYEI